MQKCLLLVAALALASCAPPGASSSGLRAPQTRFVINSMTQTDANIQGCLVMLASAEAPDEGYVFLEDGLEDGGKGFVRLDGELILVHLIGSKAGANGGERSFADVANTTQVVEAYSLGEANDASDSVGLSGTLTVTHDGSTQTLQVTGHIAC